MFKERHLDLADAHARHAGNRAQVILRERGQVAGGRRPPVAKHGLEVRGKVEVSDRDVARVRCRKSASEARSGRRRSHNIQTHTAYPQSIRRLREWASAVVGSLAAHPLSRARVPGDTRCCRVHTINQSTLRRRSAPLFYRSWRCSPHKPAPKPARAAWARDAPFAPSPPAMVS